MAGFATVMHVTFLPVIRSARILGTVLPVICGMRDLIWCEFVIDSPQATVFTGICYSRASRDERLMRHAFRQGLVLPQR